MTVGQRVKHRREELGLSVIDLAEKLRKSRSTIYRYENNEIQDMPITVLEPLAEALSTTPKYLMGWTDDPCDYYSDDTNEDKDQGSDDERAAMNTPCSVPVLGRIPAGIPIEAIEDVIDVEELSADMFRGGREYFGLRVSGDSMLPEYKNGDTLILLKTDACENGDDCAVMIDGDDATFKRVKLSDRGLTLMPLNPLYDPMPFTNEEIQALPVRIIGVVVEVRRRIRR